ncbi:MAG: Smr/MutS family protein [Deltaproteobacteria bacterium]|nr:Smr/MutS family protein [Deltaproteobacteria bacterium]
MDATLEPIVPKTLSALGWNELIGHLSQRARTPLGREQCQALVPEVEPGVAQARLARIEEARVLLAVEKEAPLADAPDVREALARASREGTLEAPQLLSVARLIRTSVAVRRFLASQADRAPLLHADAEELSDLAPLASELESVFDAAGKIVDTASPLLSELREKARGLHKNIKVRLDGMLEDPEIVGMLRDAYYSVRGDRYVLPIRAEHKSHLDGIVHNASGSGQTLFVEPQALVELGNQLTIAEAGVLEEEQRILAELSQAVGRRATELLADLEKLAALDVVLAGAHLADDLGATAPKLSLDTGSFELPGLRHPLLVLQTRERAKTEGREVRAALAAIVKNDVRLPGAARGLVVSGPNAGGKTVTITAVGLCALMARAGLPIAAGEGAAIALYRSVLTAIHDEGDLSRGLSTFTAHLAALTRTLAAAGPGALIVIDEMAADTDPREGAAIARATLEALVDAGAQVLITTHLEELKGLALADARFAAASVGFDVVKLAPTYRLAMGQVGASAAIEIARRVGLPEAVCQRAEAVLGGGSSAISAAVEQLERARAEALHAKQAAQEAEAKFEKERLAFERERKALKALEQATREAARDLLIEDLEQKRQEAARIVAELQQRPTIAGAVETQKQLSQLRADEEAQGDREKARAEVAAETDALRARGQAEEHTLETGTPVRHARFGTEGVIIELLGNQALVQLGALKTKVSLDDLVVLPRASKTPQAQLKRTKAERLARGEEARAKPVETRLALVDVRGMRVDEAIRAVDEALDGYLRQGEAEVHVQHGHGSGALKGAVREHLQRSPYVARTRQATNQEGADQVTVAVLRS